MVWLEFFSYLLPFALHVVWLQSWSSHTWKYIDLCAMLCRTQSYLWLHVHAGTCPFVDKSICDGVYAYLHLLLQQQHIHYPAPHSHTTDCRSRSHLTMYESPSGFFTHSVYIIPYTVSMSHHLVFTHSVYIIPLMASKKQCPCFS